MENGSGRKAAAAAAERGAAAYRAALRDLAGKPTLETWYAHLDVADLVQREASRKRRGRDEKALDKVRRRTSAQVAGKLTERVDGTLRFKSLPPLVSPLRDLVGEDGADQVRELILRASPGTARASPPSAAGSSTGSTSWTWRARSSASAASARAVSSACSSATATTTCSSCSSRRPAAQCSSPTPGAASIARAAPVRQRPAPGAGGERRLPRLERARGGAALLLAAAARHEGLGRDRDARAEAVRRVRAPAPGVSRMRMPAPATRSPSPPTSAPATHSTRPWARSQQPTPSRRRPIGRP